MSTCLAYQRKHISSSVVRQCGQRHNPRSLAQASPRTYSCRHVPGRCPAFRGDANSISEGITALKLELQELEAEKQEAFATAETFSRRSKNLLGRVQTLTEYALEKVSQGDEESARATLKTKASIKGALDKATAKASYNVALAKKLDDVIARKQQVLLRLLAAAKELPLEVPASPRSLYEPPVQSDPSSSGWSSRTIYPQDAYTQTPQTNGAEASAVPGLISSGSPGTPLLLPSSVSLSEQQPTDVASAQQEEESQPAGREAIQQQGLPQSDALSSGTIASTSVDAVRAAEQESEALRVALQAVAALVEKGRAAGGAVAVNELEELKQLLHQVLDNKASSKSSKPPVS